MNEIEAGAWGHLQQPKKEYDWMTDEIRNLFGGKYGF